jgi:hypothetical protein
VCVSVRPSARPPACCHTHKSILFLFITSIFIGVESEYVGMPTEYAASSERWNTNNWRELSTSVQAYGSVPPVDSYVCNCTKRHFYIHRLLITSYAKRFSTMKIHFEAVSIRIVITIDRHDFNKSEIVYNFRTWNVAVWNNIFCRAMFSPVNMLVSYNCFEKHCLTWLMYEFFCFAFKWKIPLGRRRRTLEWILMERCGLDSYGGPL